MFLLSGRVKYKFYFGVKYVFEDYILNYFVNVMCMKNLLFIIIKWVLIYFGDFLKSNSY